MKKSVEEIKDKLRKLFAMMEDGNGASQQEVETAMKIAKKLMAEYKISMNEIGVDHHDEDIEKVILGGITFTSTVNPWVATLLKVVADNYCVYPFADRDHNAKTRTACFMGYREDIEIAKFVMKYAYESIISGYDRISKEYERRLRRTAVLNGKEYVKLTASEHTSARNAYGNGFVQGIYEAFEAQKKEEAEKEKESGENMTPEESFALVMSVPNAVMERANEEFENKSFNSDSANEKARNFDKFAVNGYIDGVQFRPNRRLGEGGVA